MKNNKNQSSNQHNHLKKQLLSMVVDSQQYKDFTKKYALTDSNDFIFGFQNNQFNLTDQDDYDNSVAELQNFILKQVKKMEMKQLKNNVILASLTDDLQEQINDLQEQIINKICPKTKVSTNYSVTKIKQRKSVFSKQTGKLTRNSSFAQNCSPTPTQRNCSILMNFSQVEQKLQAILKIRMHQQAINKILVFVHGMSQFRLVSSHFHIAQAYNNLKCSQQAIDHFTIALKKNSKIIQIKETKIYHSYIMTNLSKCYYDIQYYQDAIQVLNRAFQIQQVHANSQIFVNSIKTIKMISNCYLKIKNYPLAIQFIQKALLIIQKQKGTATIDYVQLKFSKAVIIYEEGDLQNAIQNIKQSISLLKNQDSQINNRQICRLLIKFYKKLEEIQERFGDFENQIYSYREIQNIVKKMAFAQKFTAMDLILNVLKTKRKIAVLFIDHGDQISAIRQLEQISIEQIREFGEHSQQVYKTLRMIGIAYLSTGQQPLASQYFKKSNKIYKTLKNGHSKRKQTEQDCSKVEQTKIVNESVIE